MTTKDILLRTLKRSQSSINTDRASLDRYVKDAVGKPTTDSDEIIRVLNVVKVYQSIDGTLGHTLKAIDLNQNTSDVMTEAHIGQVTVRALRGDPASFLSDDAIIAHGPMRMATLTVLAKTQGTLQIEKIRERISAGRTIRATQRKRLAGQGGIQSWEHQVSNHLVRLGKEDLVERTGFGEYQATTKGRKVVEEIKQQAKRTNG